MNDNINSQDNNNYNDSTINNTANPPSDALDEFNQVESIIHKEKLSREDLLQAREKVLELKTLIDNGEIELPPPPSVDISGGSEMGRSLRKLPPGQRKRSSSQSVISNINGSVLAVGLMMLNVVIVGIMYIILAIAKIGG